MVVLGLKYGEAQLQRSVRDRAGEHGEEQRVADRQEEVELAVALHLLEYDRVRLAVVGRAAIAKELDRVDRARHTTRAARRDRQQLAHDLGWTCAGCGQCIGKVCVMYAGYAYAV